MVYLPVWGPSLVASSPCVTIRSPPLHLALRPLFGLALALAPALGATLYRYHVLVFAPLANTCG